MWTLLLAALVPQPITADAPPQVPPQIVRRPPSVITNPGWLTQPTGADLLAVFPPRALEKGISGRVELECEVEVDTTLSGCTVIEEDPAGMGFGRAGLLLADKMRMRPQTVDGAPVRGAKVIVPLSFKIAPGFNFDFGLANSLPDAERCVGYAFQLAKDPGSDLSFQTWSDWFTGDALAAGLKPNEASKRLSASIQAARAAIKTDKGAAEAEACRQYFAAWQAQSIGVPVIPLPPPKPK